MYFYETSLEHFIMQSINKMTSVTIFSSVT